MKHSHLLFLFIPGFFLLSCQRVTNAENLKKIGELEKTVNEIRNSAPANPAEVDIFPFQELAIAYVDFVDKYPDATEAPDFLFKAGELYSQELNDLPRALDLFTRDYQQYPDHPTAPHALFLKGYLYNNTLHDYKNAELFYKEFLNKYPKHELAKSARFEIEQMGVPADELLRRLQQESGGKAADSVTQKGIK